jgi:6-phosphogluconolactonase (cycloisomerase 2 family)
MLSLVAPVAAGADSLRHGSAHDVGARHAVFVQTDNTSGNQIVAYNRAPDGLLTWDHTYDTNGLGGELNGSVVDHLASQASLAYDASHSLVFAVNAGSNTVSVFSAFGDDLRLRQVVWSGGAFPVSVAIHGNLVYVLNALDGGSVSGFRIDGGWLHRIWGSTRSLGLTIPTDTTQFTHTPGQVAFSPDGSQLLVTSKANGNDVDVFAVRPDGKLSWSPTVNAEPGTVPFAITFDAAGRLVLAEAGTDAVATFGLASGGNISPISSAVTNEAATCWVTQAQGFLFASDAGGPAETSVKDSSSGQLTVLSNTATDPGAVDASASRGGQYLYVQTGKSGVVDEFSVGSSGALSPVGAVTVPDAVGGEGIVAF